MTSPFDYINSISHTKEPLDTSDYNSFMVNRGLSQFHDTVYHANEMNKLYNLDDELKFQYLINIVRPKKRFSKWAKKTDNEDIDLIMKYYNYNVTKAKSALSIISAEQIKTIKDIMLSKGK